MINKNIFIVPMFLLGACESPQIQDQTLDDRVKACGAGFTVETQGALKGALNKAALNGELSGDVKEESKAAIFSEVSDGDKIKIYEDYISCIEKDWNRSKIKLKRYG